MACLFSPRKSKYIYNWTICSWWDGYNTPAQYIEIKAAFDFYWTLYEAELKLFTTAFIYKNEMLPSDAGTSLDSLSEEEASRILQLMNGIQKKTMLKRLETSK